MPSTSAPVAIRPGTAEMSYGEQLTGFLKHAAADDPICICGCRQHQHSDDGPCYRCRDCDLFEEQEK